MTAERRLAAHKIYLAARSLSAAEQTECLDRECRGDTTLREEVQVMLASVVDLPAVPSGLRTLPLSESGDPPSVGTKARVERIQKLSEQSNTNSRYEFQEEIGRGGQGAILKVFDNDLRRTLAMKVILQRAEPGSQASTQVSSGVLARFLEEAQVTGQLDHPGVIPVHELGVDSSGRVYFTMPLVKGRELRQIIREVHEGNSEWTQARSLSVLLKVCEAMAYAHDKGVIHRDLKPANVMVGKYGEVYVMDWGLARVAGREDSRDIRLRRSSMELSLSVVETDRKEAKDESRNSPLVTMDGSVVGTPAYMPPEQAAGRVEEVNTRSDVYALGAMLYHLLTGRAPYFSPGEVQFPHSVLNAVLEGPPTPVHDLAPYTPAELEAICEKAMARKSSERYPDMGALGEDLRAFLEGRVVHAYQSGALAEFRKWVGRNRGTAAALAAAVLILIIGLFASWLLYVEARENGEQAVEQSYVAGILAADISFQRGRIVEARAYLSKCDEPLRKWEWFYLKQRIDGGLTQDLGQPVTAMAYTADGAKLVVGTADGRVSVRDVETGKEKLTFAGSHKSAVVATAWSSDGRRVLSLGGRNDRNLYVWDAESGQRLDQELELDIDALCAAFDNGLSKLAVGTVGNEVHLFTIGDELDTLTPRGVLEGHSGSVLAVAFLPDGEHLVSGSEDRSVRLWSLAEAEPLRVHPTGSSVYALAVHPEGTEYAAGLEGGKITRWSRDTEEPLGDLVGHTGVVYALAYSPIDGHRLASTSWDRSVRVWDVAGSTLLTTLWGHEEAIRCLAVRRDGFHLATGSTDETLRLWSSQRDGAVDSWSNPEFQEYVSAALFDAESRHVLIGASYNANIGVVDVEDGTSTWRSGVSDGVTSLAQSPDCSLYAAALLEAREIRVWKYQSGEPLSALTDHPDTILAICFTADGKHIVSGYEDGTLRIWPATGGESIATLTGHKGPVNAVAAFTDGTWLVSASYDGTCRLWDQATGSSVREPVDLKKPVYSIAIDPKGRRLALGYGEREVALYDLDTESLERFPTGHDNRVGALGFSPDGLRLVTGSDDKTLGIWHVEDARNLLTLRGHTGQVTSASFSPDGTRILSSSMDGTVRVWSGRPEIR